MSARQLLTAVGNPAWLCFCWFGISSGAGLLATVARFQAGSLTRPVALDVGREVFALLNQIELLMLVAFLVLIRVTGQARGYLVVGGALALIVMLQSAWLLPTLSARTDIVLAGGTPPESMTHALYSGLEIVKLGLLLGGGFSALAKPAASRRG